jgi:YD repeat-containing protein
MRKLYVHKRYYWPIWILCSLIGCHQEPLVPTSIIPPACRVSQLININENVRDTTNYAYNAFGQVEKSTYRQWVSGQLRTSLEQNFVYSADHYLITQIDRSTNRLENGTLVSENKGYLYEYSDVPKRIQTIRIYNNDSNETLGFREYTYEGERLKTYVESDGKKAVSRRFTYDGSGKLIQLDEPNARIRTTSLITNGRVTQKTYADSTITSYEYDSQGQLTRRVTNTSREQLQYTFSYDNKPYWTKTQLLLRGFPAHSLGDNSPIHNVITSGYQRSQDNRLVANQQLTYRHTYNKEGYSLGFGRSDGARQIIYYNNCP